MENEKRVVCGEFTNRSSTPVAKDPQGVPRTPPRAVENGSAGPIGAVTQCRPEAEGQPVAVLGTPTRLQEEDKAEDRHSPPGVSVLSTEGRKSPIFPQSSKILKNYFFLKNLNLLPLTPERNPKSPSSSSRFQRTSVVQRCTGNSSPPLHEEPLYSLHTNCEDAHTIHDVLCSVNAHPEKQTGHVTVRKPTLRILNAGNADVLLTNVLSIQKFATMKSMHSHTVTSNSLTEVGISNNYAVSTEDVFVEFAYPITVRESPKCVKGTTIGHTLLQSQSLLLSHERLLCNIVKEHKESLRALSLGEGSRPGIMTDKAYQWIFTYVTSEDAASCESLHQCLDEMLRYHFEVAFQSYRSKVLELAFVILYTKMVAIPMLRWMEYYARRVVCMRRDIGIRSMIELFLFTFARNKPHRGLASERAVNRAPSHFTRKKIPNQQRLSPTSTYSARGQMKQNVSVRTLCNERSTDIKSYVVENNTNTTTNNKDVNTESDPKRSDRPLHNVSGCSSKPPVLRPLQGLMIVQSIERKRTPPPRPKDNDFTDILGLTIV